MRRSLNIYRPVLKYLRPHARLLRWGILCSIVFGISSGLGIPLILEKVLRVVFEAPPDTYSFVEILAIALAIPLIFLVRSVFGFLGTYLLTDAGLRLLNDLRADIFTRLQVLPFSYFESQRSGDLISRVNNDSSLLQILILEFTTEGIKQPFQMAAGIGALIYLCIAHEDIVFLLLFIAAMPFAMMPVIVLARRLRKRGRQSVEALGNMNHQLEESLGATLEIRTLNLEDRQQELFNERLDAYKQAQLRLVAYEKVQQPSMEMVAMIIVAIGFVYCYLQQIDYPTFSALALVLYFTFDPLKKILRVVANTQKTEPAVLRIREVLEAPLPPEPQTSPLPCPRLKGDIEARDLVFAYGDKPVLQGLNVKIPAGTFCALVGASGAGKSTFAKLLPRLHEVTDGSLLVDGQPVSRWEQQGLRRNIAFLSQHPVLFHLSVRDNIRLSRPEATDAEVEAAADQAYATEFIQALPQGWNTLLGERGSNLSGGQIQRIALARTFLKNAPILILDEATSALDSQSEALIQKALERLIVGKTVLCIAHRLSTIRNADLILVFDKGTIAASGTHQQLLESSPIYANLVRNQIDPFSSPV